ncbi:MAG: hypothetical protein RL563_2667 [Pseudomonadota bacterium]|jgi:hypothetical protein
MNVLTKQEVIKMAREAGAERSCINDEVWMLALAETGFEKFAALAYAAGVAAEREECARLCETPIDEIQITDDISEFRYMDAQECAATIRARGEK